MVPLVRIDLNYDNELLFLRLLKENSKRFTQKHREIRPAFWVNFLACAIVNIVYYCIINSGCAKNGVRCAKNGVLLCQKRCPLCQGNNLCNNLVFSTLRCATISNLVISPPICCNVRKKD